MQQIDHAGYLDCAFFSFTFKKELYEDSLFERLIPEKKYSVGVSTAKSSSSVRCWYRSGGEKNLATVLVLFDRTGASFNRNHHQGSSFSKIIPGMLCGK